MDQSPSANVGTQYASEATMTDQFTLDDRDLKKLEKFFKKAPHVMQQISAGVLSSMAFVDRKGVMRILGREMIIRSPSLLKKGTRVQMAKPSQPIGSQEAISGSVRTTRHDAWEHVETGKPTRATVFSNLGRGGSKTGKGVSSAKHTRAQTFESDFKLKGSGDIKTVRYLQAIQRDKARGRKTFFLPRQYKSLKRGIYKFKGSRKPGKAKIRMMSYPSGVNVMDPKKIGWKEKATKSSVTPAFVKRSWVDNSQRLWGSVKM